MVGHSAPNPSEEMTRKAISWGKFWEKPSTMVHKPQMPVIQIISFLRGK